MRSSLIAALFLSLMLVVAACNGDDTDDVDTPTDTDSPATDVTPEDDDATVDDDAATPDVDTTPETGTTPETDTTPDADMTPDADATPDVDTTPEAGTTPDSDATPGTDGATTEDDADEILERAAERAEELETARFQVEGTGQIEVEDIGEVSLQNAEGAVERPDRAQVEFDIDVAGMEVPLTVVSIDGDVYFTDVFSGSWHSAPEEFQFNPAIIFDSDDGIPALIRSVEDAEVLGTEQVDGRDAYHIFGVVDRETIESGTSGVFQATEDVDFEAWIDQETYDVLQVRAQDPTDESDSVWEMRIYDHDEPVEIEEPDNGSS